MMHDAFMQRIYRISRFPTYCSPTKLLPIYLLFNNMKNHSLKWMFFSEITNWRKLHYFTALGTNFWRFYTIIKVFKHLSLKSSDFLKARFFMKSRLLKVSPNIFIEMGLSRWLLNFVEILASMVLCFSCKTQTSFRILFRI